MQWRVIETGGGEAAWNMALDEAISTMVRAGGAPPTLRLYGWSSPSVSLGAFQRLDEVDLGYCTRRGISLVRRLTGGRGILHNDEVTYSFSSRNEAPFAGGLRETYRLISQVLRAAFSGLGLDTEMQADWRPGIGRQQSPVCFQVLSFGEISFRGKKLVGSAQRRWSDGFLQQGSIPCSLDLHEVEAVFPERAGQGGRRLSDRMSGLGELIPGFRRDFLRDHILRAFEGVFRVSLADAVPSPQESELALRLVEERYRNPQWTQGPARHTRS